MRPQGWGCRPVAGAWECPQAPLNVRWGPGIRRSSQRLTSRPDKGRRPHQHPQGRAAVLHLVCRGRGGQRAGPAPSPLPAPLPGLQPIGWKPRVTAPFLHVHVGLIAPTPSGGRGDSAAPWRFSGRPHQRGILPCPLWTVPGYLLLNWPGAKHWSPIQGPQTWRMGDRFPSE